MIVFKPSPFLARISYWPRASASSLAKIAAASALGLDAAPARPSASASTIICAFSALAGASSSARFSASIFSACASAALRHRPVLRLAAPPPRPRASSSRRAGTPRPCLTAQVGVGDCAATARPSALALLAGRRACRVRPRRPRDRRLCSPTSGPSLAPIALSLLDQPVGASARRPAAPSRARRPGRPARASASRVPISRSFVGVGDLDRPARARPRRRRSAPRFSCSATSILACWIACDAALRPIASM